MADFIHYTKRIVAQPDYSNPTDPWFERNQPDDQGFDAPAYHITRSTSGPATRVTGNDLIWLFSQLRGQRWGNGPMALDARLVVARSIPERQGKNGPEPGFTYPAKPSSEWFMLFDAGPYLQRLETVTKNGKRSRLIQSGAVSQGGALRTLKEVWDPAPLHQLVDAINRAPRHFISYRLLDGARPAFDKAQQLVANGCAVCWDRWSLPRRLAERREFLSSSKMTERLFDQMKTCDAVWGIETETYGRDGSYSAEERKVAMALGRYHAVAP